MALAKDHSLTESSMCLNHVYPYYESSDHFGGSDHDSSPPAGIYGNIEDHHHPHQQLPKNKLVFEDDDHTPTKPFPISTSSSLSSPTSTNSSGLTFKYQSDEGNSVISFKSGYNGNLTHPIGSLLSFEQKENFHHHQNIPFPRIKNQDDFSIWEDDINHNNFQNQLKSKSKTLNPPHVLENDVQFGWINSEATATTSGIADFGRDEACLNKRPFMEESTQANKKRCISPEKQVTPKSSPSSSKDPQSLAAKNRRERISERLKTLQELVPNGSKVDLVTMLEKAISYVKFLQLQVKVLATDDFWPAQGGKAPELSQVKEALDAILASQRDRSSNSK